MLDVQGLRSFQRSIQATKARAEGKATLRYRQFVQRVFTDLVMHTPQWSGNLAANWQIRLTNDGPAPLQGWYKKGHTGGFKDRTYEQVQLGDGEAPFAAIERAAPQIDRIFWNTRVSFENPVAYAQQVAEGQGPKSPRTGQELPLRPMHVPAAAMMTHYIVAKYSRGDTLLWSSE